jgi:hypothetical protein
LQLPFAGVEDCEAEVQEIYRRMPNGVFSLKTFLMMQSNTTHSGRGSRLVNIVLCSGQGAKKSAQEAKKSAQEPKKSVLEVKKSTQIKQAECPGPSTFDGEIASGYRSHTINSFFFYLTGPKVIHTPALEISDKKIKQEEQLERCNLPDTTKIAYLEGLKRKCSQEISVQKTCGTFHQLVPKNWTAINDEKMQFSILHIMLGIIRDAQSQNIKSQNSGLCLEIKVF